MQNGLSVSQVPDPGRVQGFANADKVFWILGNWRRPACVGHLL